MTTELATPLTSGQEAVLAGCEATIERGLSSFVVVGQALARVHDERLYRDTHTSFQKYVEGRWEMTRSNAYELIGACAVRRHLEMSGTPDILPVSVSQCRPLLTFSEPDPEDKRNRVINMGEIGDVWAEVIEKAEKDDDGNPHITAKHVASVVERWRAEANGDAEDDPGEGSEAEGTPADEEAAVEGHPDGDEPEDKPEVAVTVEERRLLSNKRLEQLARKIGAISEEAEELNEPHLTARLEILQAQLRTAQGTVRVSKGKAVCSYCDAKGCGPCEGTGWLTAVQVESAPRRGGTNGNGQR